MIILDNSVLSAFSYLNLLPSLEKLLKSAFITKEIQNEYSIRWQQSIPGWIQILEADKNIALKEIPLSLSSADLSVIRLALERNLPLASDDRPLRNYAKKLKISITGSLGLLKSLYQKKLIETKDKYIFFLQKLQEIVYISADLLKWALEG